MMADASEADALTNDNEDCEKIDPDKSRFPYCIVWTPIPGLSSHFICQQCLPEEKGQIGRGRWLLPFIGHMGICTSSGVIRDFAGPYCVSEDDMAFGKPTKYWRLDVSKVCGGSPEAWDMAVRDASEQYGHKMHILCCDNCHSYVALALNLMRYDGSSTWNMINLCLLSLLHSKHVSIADSLKTWLPFLLLYGVIITVTVVLNVH